MIVKSIWFIVFMVFGVVVGWNAIPVSAFNVHDSDSTLSNAGRAPRPAMSMAVGESEDLSSTIQKWHLGWHMNGIEWCSTEEERVFEESRGLVLADLQLIYGLVDSDYQELSSQAFHEAKAMGNSEISVVAPGAQTHSKELHPDIIVRRTYIPTAGGFVRTVSWVDPNLYPDVYLKRGQLVVLAMLAKDLGLVLKTETVR